MFRLTLCTLAAAAALLSGYLLWSYATGNTAPSGCGGSGGCGDALNDRWSLWLGMPVSAPGLALYLTIFFAGCFVGPHQSTGHRRRAWGVLVGCSALAIGAGAWFTSRQIVEGHYCRFCLGIHAIGAAIATLVWLKLWSVSRSNATEAEPIRVMRSAAVGLTGLALLIGSQLIFPSFSIARMLLGEDSSTSGVSFLSGVRFDDLPTLGSRGASRRIVVLADYTCEKCLRTHRMLERLRPMLSDSISIVILPMPLDPRCNPILREVDPRHEHACELARLALAAWRANPSRFADMDDWLFAIETPPALSSARSYAVTLVGEPALKQAENDHWVDSALSRSVDLYQRCGGGVVPKLLIGSTLLDGEPSGLESLLSSVQREWGPEALDGSAHHSERDSLKAANPIYR